MALISEIPLEPEVQQLGSTSFGNITENKGVNVGNALSSTVVGG